MQQQLSPLSTADTALWAAHGELVRELPTPTPLALLELPLARMQRRLTRPAPQTDLLPQTAWERFHSVRGPDGRHYAARIAGDPRAGLAVQGDWSVLVALMALYDAEGWSSPTLVAPPLRSIARLMRAEEGGVTVQRIKAALTRFALTRVTLVPMRKGEDPNAILARATVLDEESPSEPEGPQSVVVTDPPSPGAVTEAMHGAPVGRVHAVLDVEWGESGIAAVTLGRAWCPGEQAQPALWIEADRYFELVDPLARRLYVLLAASVARGSRGPWEPTFAWLRTAAGYDPGLKRSRVLRELREAADELVRRDVVSDVTLAPARGEPQLVSFSPGVALAIPRMLQGFGLTEPPDDRTALALLRAFGFSPEEARGRLAARPERVREALCYVCFRRELTHHDGVRRIDHPRAYLERVLDSDQPFADDAFQRWYRSLLARVSTGRPVLSLAASGGAGGAGGAAGTRGAERGAGEIVGASTVRGAPRMGPHTGRAPHGRPALEDPRAAGLWEAVAERLRGDAALTVSTPFFVAVLEEYCAIGVVAGVLELVTDSDVYLRLARRPAIAEALAAAVADASGGDVASVCVTLRGRADS